MLHYRLIAFTYDRVVVSMICPGERRWTGHQFRQFGRLLLGEDRLNEEFFVVVFVRLSRRLRFFGRGVKGAAGFAFRLLLAFPPPSFIVFGNLDRSFVGLLCLRLVFPFSLQVLKWGAPLF